MPLVQKWKNVRKMGSKKGVGQLGIFHESVYTFSWYFGCIQVSGVRREPGKTCAVLKANAANLNTETRPSFRTNYFC
jgi:hypothetical protein